MTACPLCARRPCAITGCTHQARPTDLTCWHHADTQPCGCPTGEGHTCRPSWMDEAEWVAAPGKRELDQVGCEAAPAGASTPGEGLTANLSHQEGAGT